MRTSEGLGREGEHWQSCEELEEFLFIVEEIKCFCLLIFFSSCLFVPFPASHQQIFYEVSRISTPSAGKCFCFRADKTSGVW